MVKVERGPTTKPRGWRFEFRNHLGTRWNVSKASFYIKKNKRQRDGTSKKVLKQTLTTKPPYRCLNQVASGQVWLGQVWLSKSRFKTARTSFFFFSVVSAPERKESFKFLFRSNPERDSSTTFTVRPDLDQIVLW